MHELSFNVPGHNISGIEMVLILPFFTIGYTVNCTLPSARFAIFCAGFAAL